MNRRRFIRDAATGLFVLGSPGIILAAQQAHRRASFTGGSGADTLTGLVGWWKLNEGTGFEITDSSGSGNGGVAQNSPTWGSGYLTFNGSNQYIGIATSGSLYPSSPITVAAWVNSPNPAADDYILSAWEGSSRWSLGIASANYKETGGGTASRGLNSLPANDTWYHFAAVIDAQNSDILLYLNGSLNQGSLTTTGAGWTANTPNINMGTLNAVDSPYGWFTGSLDDVRIYNRALSAVDIAALAIAPE